MQQQQQWQKILPWLAWGGVLLVGLLLCIKSLREPDVWWMLRTGEWIWQNKQVPTQDVFSYTFNGAPWINVKWGFELLLYATAKLFGPESTFLLQITATLLMLWLGWRSYQRLYSGMYGRRIARPDAAAIMGGLVLLAAIEYRMIGRPEMVSHAMTAAFVFILLRHRYKPSKAIFWLALLQLLWTNLHEAYGTGLVIMLAWLGVSWFEYLLSRKWDKKLQLKAPKQLSLAVLAAIAVIAINPRGPQMIWHPFEILGQVYENKYTTELLGFRDIGYWQIEAYLAFGVLALLLIALANQLWQQRKNLKQFVVKVGLAYPLLIIMFFYLALTAYRNIPFFVLVSAPLLTLVFKGIIYRIRKRFNWQPNAGWPYALALAICIVAYGFVGSGNYYKALNKRDNYGWLVHAAKNPIGAAEFIQQNNIQGRCFSDYLTSSYLLWELRPDFKTFIDLRDLDVFPAEFFDDYMRMTYDYAYFTEQDSIYQFDYVVLHRPMFEGLHYYLYNAPEYELVFVDAVAAVYLKNQPAYEGLISEYSRPGEDILSPASYYEATGFAQLIDNIFWPPFKGNRIKTSRDLIAASYYQFVGQLQLAIGLAEKASQQEDYEAESFEMLGSIYLRLAQQPNNPDASAYLQSAIAYYEQAIAIDAKRAQAHLGKGAVLLTLGQTQPAIIAFEEAMKQDAELVQAYMFASEAYRRLDGQTNFSSQQYLSKWVAYSQKAADLGMQEPYQLFVLGIGYCRLGECKKAAPLLQQYITAPGVQEGEVQFANNCLMDCGL